MWRLKIVVGCRTAEPARMEKLPKTPKADESMQSFGLCSLCQVSKSSVASMQVQAERIVVRLRIGAYIEEAKQDNSVFGSKRSGQKSVSDQMC